MGMGRPQPIGVRWRALLGEPGLDPEELTHTPGVMNLHTQPLGQERTQRTANHLRCDIAAGSVDVERSQSGAGAPSGGEGVPAGMPGCHLMGMVSIPPGALMHPPDAVETARTVARGRPFWPNLAGLGQAAGAIGRRINDRGDCLCDLGRGISVRLREQRIVRYSRHSNLLTSGLTPIGVVSDPVRERRAERQQVVTIEGLGDAHHERLSGFSY